MMRTKNRTFIMDSSYKYMNTSYVYRYEVPEPNYRYKNNIVDIYFLVN